jgi:type II secretory pathway component GspD/PulD (secretin)
MFAPSRVFSFQNRFSLSPKVRVECSQRWNVFVLSLVVCLFVISANCIAQPGVIMQSADGVVVGPDGQPIAMPPGATSGKPPGAPGQTPPGQTTPGKPGKSNGASTPGQPNQPVQPADAAAANGKPESIMREAAPPEPPNKREFDAKPDDQGMIQFQFRNQPWPDLLRWLAEASNLSLDWQELPSDYLNIATQRKYTLEEARDLFNRHLLARGYTMLELDGMIQVVKTAGINVALVPKIAPEALTTLPPNRFVRTSFSLNTLMARDVVKEFEPLISTNGKLNALESTNRLEAMDSAANLAEIYRVLDEEQSEIAQAGLAREFELEFVRASEAKEQLSSFIGFDDKSSSKRPTTPQEMMMQQQQMQMQMQQQQQQGKQPALPNKPSEIYIVANVRRNSIIAHAPPNKMAVIAAFIKRIDVPNDSAANMQRMETRMRVFRLTSLDPKQLVASMIAMDALEPTTKLEVDEKNKAIIAYASLGDQLLIQQTIDRLDGSARDVEVIQLRRLRAEDVAGTIKFLMGKEEQKEDNRNRYYDPWGSSQKKEATDGFRVGANTQDNQILLWATDAEIKEVNKLLMKLGELPPEGGNKSRVRVIDASRSQETKEYLQRLQEAWSKMSPNPLKLPEDFEFELDKKKDAAKPTEPIDSEEPMKAKGEETDSNNDNKNKREKTPAKDITEVSIHSTSLRNPAVANPRISRLSNMVAFQSSDDSKPEKVKGDVKSGESDSQPKTQSSAGSTTNANAKPIEISFDEAGNLVLKGDDLEALDRLERIMQTNAPPQKSYEVFYIKNARPSWIELNLKDYFKEDDEKGKKDSDLFGFIFGFDMPKEKKSDPQLGRQRKLKFISDSDTRSLMVIGADEKQIKTIRELIELWDVPEKTNKQRLRFTKLVRIEHSNADSVVETIKDAYRDLLSTNDKAFSKGKTGAGGATESKHDDSGDSISEGGGMNFSFTGRLSMGIDRVTNSILVSAEGEDLLKLVIEMIKELDKAAEPSGAVQMIQLGSTNSEAMEKALMALMRNGGDKNQRQQPSENADKGRPPQNQQQQTSPPSNKNKSSRSR